MASSEMEEEPAYGMMVDGSACPLCTYIYMYVCMYIQYIYRARIHIHICTYTYIMGGIQKGGDQEGGNFSRREWCP